MALGMIRFAVHINLNAGEDEYSIMQFKHKNNLEVYLQVYVPLWYHEMSFVTGASSKRLKEYYKGEMRKTRGTANLPALPRSRRRNSPWAS